LIFLYYPVAKKNRNKIGLLDLIPVVLVLASIGYMLIDFEEFIYRAATPELWDKIFGVILILLVLEAARRSSGWIMPIVVIVFLIYAFIGPALPPPWTHRGYDMDRIVGHMYMTLEGIFGVPIDVSSTFIILFTIYGAFLDVSGAGKFFIDFSLGPWWKVHRCGRTVTLASFLLRPIRSGLPLRSPSGPSPTPCWTG
jgi:TRAP-type uncharacterized transport system fused permease subunit